VQDSGNSVRLSAVTVDQLSELEWEGWLKFKRGGDKE